MPTSGSVCDSFEMNIRGYPCEVDVSTTYYEQLDTVLIVSIRLGDEIFAYSEYFDGDPSSLPCDAFNDIALAVINKFDSFLTVSGRPYRNPDP